MTYHFPNHHIQTKWHLAKIMLIKIVNKLNTLYLIDLNKAKPRKI